MYWPDQHRWIRPFFVMVERKCLNCNTWNKDEDYCINCGSPISPKAIDKQKADELAKIEANKVPSKIEIYQEKARNSKYLIVRAGYYVVYSIFVFLGAIGAFLAWLAAMANA